MSGYIFVCKEICDFGTYSCLVPHSCMNGLQNLFGYNDCEENDKNTDAHDMVVIW